MNYLSKYTAILEEICNKTDPGKKMIQKLMYLIERKGTKLDLNYSIHFFGPYSARLDNTLHVLESNDVIKIDTSGITHKISMGDVSHMHNELKPEELEKVNFVIDKFINKSALELEAITTLDYVATKLLNNNSTDSDIINKVKEIKGSKFTEDYLIKELNILKKYEFLD